MITESATQDQDYAFLRCVETHNPMGSWGLDKAILGMGVIALASCGAGYVCHRKGHPWAALALILGSLPIAAYGLPLIEWGFESAAIRRCDGLPHTKDSCPSGPCL